MKRALAAVLAVVVVGAVATVIMLSPASYDPSPRAPRFATTGSSADVAHLTTVVPRILADITAAGRVEPDDAAAAYPSEEERGRLVEERRRELEGLLPPDQVPDTLHAYEAGWTRAADDPGSAHLAYAGVTFRLDSVDGIAVDADTARVALTGALVYAMHDGDVIAERASHYDVTLERDPQATHGWRRASSTAISAEGTGP